MFSSMKEGQDIIDMNKMKFTSLQTNQFQIEYELKCERQNLKHIKITSFFLLFPFTFFLQLLLSSFSFDNLRYVYLTSLPPGKLSLELPLTAPNWFYVPPVPPTQALIGMQCVLPPWCPQSYC